MMGQSLLKHSVVWACPISVPANSAPYGIRTKPAFSESRRLTRPAVLYVEVCLMPEHRRILGA